MLNNINLMNNNSKNIFIQEILVLKEEQMGLIQRKIIGIMMLIKTEIVDL